MVSPLQPAAGSGVGANTNAAVPEPATLVFLPFAEPASVSGDAERPRQNQLLINACDSSTELLSIVDAAAKSGRVGVALGRGCAKFGRCSHYATIGVVICSIRGDFSVRSDAGCSNEAGPGCFVITPVQQTFIMPFLPPRQHSVIALRIVICDFQ